MQTVQLCLCLQPIILVTIYHQTVPNLLQSQHIRRKCDPHTQVFCTCPKQNEKDQAYQFSSKPKPASVPTKSQSQKYVSTYSLAYTNKYQEYMNKVTKLLPHNKTSDKENKEGKPVQFSYLEQEGLVVLDSVLEGFMSTGMGC